MGYMIDSIFRNCDFVNDDVFRVFNTSEVTHCNLEISIKIKEFSQNLTDETLKEKFEFLCNSIDDILTSRDTCLAKLLVEQGMTINMRLMSEILLGK